MSQAFAFLFPGVAWTDPNLLKPGQSLNEFPLQLKGDIVIFFVLTLCAWLIRRGTRIDRRQYVSSTRELSDPTAQKENHVTSSPKIMLAGGLGDLGFRIATALKTRGADVHLLVHRALGANDSARLERLGVIVAVTQPGDVAGMASACESAACVVSALNGLRDVIVDRQLLLLDAAVKAGVPRMISSDYSLDFTKTRPGRNRNLDLRREFMALADRRPIAITSILNGAFMDMLGAEMPIIQPAIRRVLYWGRADQLLDFTTKDDVAAFVAAAALDADTPRILRIAGGSATPRAIAEIMSTVSGKRFKTLRAGGLGGLGVMIGIAKLFGPPGAVFPPYQGMQYMRDMMSGEGKLVPLDNDRYPDLSWTSIADQLARVFAR